jgi:hypothetical protein
VEEGRVKREGIKKRVKGSALNSGKIKIFGGIWKEKI